METQTTEERTQLYHAEIDALYRDLTAKGKVLVLSSELGVGPTAPSQPRFLWASCTRGKAAALALGLYLCLGSGFGWPRNISVLVSWNRLPCAVTTAVVSSQVWASSQCKRKVRFVVK